jgi:hypothetical protein
MMNDVDPIDETAAAEEPAANRFTADARKRIALLRMVAADLTEDPKRRTLRPTEIRLARHTSAVALEKAAVFAESEPIGRNIVDPMELREVIAFELAYGGVRDAALVLAREIDLAILRRKLKSVLAVRALYRVAKAYKTFDAGDKSHTHLAELKRALVVTRRRKVAGHVTES